MDKQRWERLINILGCTNPEYDSYSKIESAYHEQHRCYHNSVHILECLQVFDIIKHQLADWPEIEAAIWLHDLVYEPGWDDNEILSLLLGEQLLLSSGCSDDKVDRISALVISTIHKGQALSESQEIICDIDLAILGQNEERFAEYEQQIRNEYLLYPLSVYKIGRKRILRQFINRKYIYNNATLRGMYEQKAKANIKQYLSFGYNYKTEQPSRISFFEKIKLWKELFFKKRPKIHLSKWPEISYLTGCNGDYVWSRHPGKSSERISWDELVEVKVKTTDEGPLSPDVFFLLKSSSGKEIMIPQGATGDKELLGGLMDINAFDHATLIKAMTSTTNNEFVCWTKSV